jgi:crotonobetainyl-CoA:carnitine CoA-transferase CaiB-like acyl-CoA transferase|tara:strand:+ start:1660 stop:2862 length:1203 start_codon:yes stop_codon:yes gene_type:complete
MKKPLESIRLIDLTHMLSGPYAGMILADMGCDVIKVEPPKKGEGTRRLLENDPNYSISGMSTYFFTLNRNKRSICIDLKVSEGLEIFYDLVKNADVVLSNFSPGICSKLKIDHDILSNINPRIITCSVSGFGESGPNYKRPAFDLIAQALGGGMSITGKSKDEPMRAGIPIGDLSAGMFAVMGIQSALIARDTTNKGQHVDISMLDCQVSMLNYMATMNLVSGLVPEPIGNAHFVHVPYNTFSTKDFPIVIAAAGDQFWSGILDVFNIDELKTSKYDKSPARQKDKGIIEDLLQKKLNTDISKNWLKKLEEKKIPCSRVNNFEQALRDEQIRYRNMIVKLQHPDGTLAEAPGNPIKLSDTHEDTFTSPPLLGQHTDEILQEWVKLDLEEINTLRKTDIIE